MGSDSQMVFRDRNCLAITRDILGAYALGIRGIRNMFCLSETTRVLATIPRQIWPID